MPEDNIKITVLMPALNAAKFIGDAIQSVLEQTFSEFELLIIDDGSVDNTPEVVRRFNDPRIVFIRQTNAGIAVALNRGLQLARAEYIARFDADDICYKERLYIQYEFMINNPECIVVGSGVDYMDEYGNYIFSFMPPAFADSQIKKLHYSICPFIHSGVLFRKSIVLDAGGYNLNAHSFEDHFLWLQIKKHGAFHNLPRTLMKVRLSPESLTIDEKWRTKEFVAIKYKSLRELQITLDEGETLIEILMHQNNKKIKRGSYHALLAKKFLWNNYQPYMARQNIRKAIKLNPFNAGNYYVFMMSFLPRHVIAGIYGLIKRSGYDDNGKRTANIKKTDLIQVS